MRTDYNHNSPIETLLTQIEDCIEFAAYEDAPYTIKQILHIALNILQHTSGEFHDAIKIQKRCPAAEKTQHNFKIHFTNAHNEYLDKVKTGQYFNAAQVLEDSLNAIQDLVNTTVQDRDAIQKLQVSNNELKNLV